MGSWPGLLESAALGAIATGAMSVVMIAGNRAGLMREQPPMTITTGRPWRGAGVERPSAVAAVMAPAGHIAFGAAGGVLYGFLRHLAPHVSGRLLGVAFGLGAVWADQLPGFDPGVADPPVARG